VTAVIVALSLASLLTAAFAFRFRDSRRPAVLVGYFLFFFAVDWIGTHFFIPPGAFGLEVAAVCFFLAGIFLVAISVSGRWDEPEDPDG
jgi:hypothetical protein